MPTPSLHSVTVIFSPYHVGIHDHAVGTGPGRIREKGLPSKLQELGIAVHEVEIGRVDDFDGDIGRSFECPGRPRGSLPLLSMLDHSRSLYWGIVVRLLAYGLG